MTTTPNIPAISTQANATEVKRAIDAIRIYFANMQKAGGAVSMNELVNYTGGGSSGSTGGTVDPGVVELPTAPVGFTVSGAFASLTLYWTAPAYSGHAHTEIWRATGDDVGVATMIGHTQATVYVDIPPYTSTSITYYYWIRHVNTDAVVGSYNGVHGVPGHTADDPDYVLELLLDSKWKPMTARALNFVGYPSAPNGYAYKVTTAGTSGATEPTWPTTINNTVADGSIVWTCVAAVPLLPPFEIGVVDGVIRTVIKSLMIGDGTITNAKIHDLAADKITAGFLAAARIGAGTITSSHIASRTIAADRIAAGAITANEIAASTITGGKIAGETITGGHIASRTISASKITADSLTATEIWGLARINGNRLSVVASGSFYGFEFTITHNLGRYVIVSASAVDSNYNTVKIAEQTTQYFKLKVYYSGGSSMADTVYYAYM